MKEINYEVNVDYNIFKDLFWAQNKKYLKRAGWGVIILFGFFTISFIFMSVYEPTTKNIIYTLLLVIITAYGIAFVTNPNVALLTRTGYIKKWFKLHGNNTDAIPKNLKTSYQIHLDNLGFTETIGNNYMVKIPWFALHETPIKTTNGIFFAFDDGKNSSLLYNSLGINFAFREDLPGEVLFIPASVLSTNPNLVNEIQKIIKQQRQQFRSSSNSSIENIKHWMLNK